MIDPPPPFRRGQSALVGPLNLLRRLIRAHRVLTAEPPLEAAFGDRGTAVRLASPLEAPAPAPAILTGAASPYQLRLAKRSGGAWVAIDPTPHGRADEATGLAGLGGKVAPLWPVAGVADTYRFVYPRKGTAGGGGTCFCSWTSGSPPPHHLQVTSSDPTGNLRIFQSGPVTLGTGPGPVWNSDGFTTDGFASFASLDGAAYCWLLVCTPTSFQLYRNIDHGTFNAAELLPRYTWPMPAAGNTCSPLSLTVGTPYAGATPVTVTVAEIP